MDVTWQNFISYLPRILDDLGSCCFVAVDFEFSGISHGNVSHGPAGPQTLQDRYIEIKRAADKYQIVQIGLTVCHEDIETGGVDTQRGQGPKGPALIFESDRVIQPEAIQLQPQPNHRPEIGVGERYCFSNQRYDPNLCWFPDHGTDCLAADFLMENKFSMDSFFKHGVRYLSRDEEHQAMAKALERRDRPMTHRSLDVKETEHESIEFLQAVRRLVDDWLAPGDVHRPDPNQNEPDLTTKTRTVRTT